MLETGVGGVGVEKNRLGPSLLCAFSLKKNIFPFPLNTTNFWYFQEHYLRIASRGHGYPESLFLELHKNISHLVPKEIITSLQSKRFLQAFRRTMKTSQVQARLLDRINNYQGTNGYQFIFLLTFIKSKMLYWLWKKQKDWCNLTIHTLLWVLRTKSLSSGSSSLHA